MLGNGLFVFWENGGGNVGLALLFCLFWVGMLYMGFLLRSVGEEGGRFERLGGLG